MSAWCKVLTGLQRLPDRVPGLRVIVQTPLNDVRHQSANQAGSVAFSAVLAMFPLLIFLSPAAGFGAQLAARWAGPGRSGSSSRK